MKNILKEYFKTHLVCPFGKTAAKQDLIHYLNHNFVNEVNISEQKDHIEGYKKFLIDRATNTSLIVTLKNSGPMENDREMLLSYSMQEQKYIVRDIQEHLYSIFGDIILWLDMANKNCDNIQDWSEKPIAARPAIGITSPIWSGGGSTEKDFIQRSKNAISGYNSVPIVDMEGLNTELTESYKKIMFMIKNIQTDVALSKDDEENNRKLQAENRHPSSFLVFYMGPIYPKNHARYAPQHNIVINNNRDVVAVSDRGKVMRDILSKTIKYEIKFFPSPI